jgi:hypothetical protein
MRFILAALLVTGCSRTATQVVPPGQTITAAATCGIAEPAPIEIKVEAPKPAKIVFDHEVCR